GRPSLGARSRQQGGSNRASCGTLQAHAAARGTSLCGGDRSGRRHGKRREIRYGRLQEHAKAARRNRGTMGRQAAVTRKIYRPVILRSGDGGHPITDAIDRCATAVGNRGSFPHCTKGGVKQNSLLPIIRNGVGLRKGRSTMMQKWRNESFVDVVNLILGAWLFATPWLYGFASGAAGWNAWIMGGLIALLAIAALAAFAEWEEWINLLLGLWVLVAPWALGFGESVGAMGNHVVVGTEHQRARDAVLVDFEPDRIDRRLVIPAGSIEIAHRDGPTLEPGKCRLTRRRIGRHALVRRDRGADHGERVVHLLAFFRAV